MAKGYDADGKLGGPYNEKNWPEGKKFGGYLKGNMGIVWKPLDPGDKEKTAQGQSAS